MQEEKIKIFFIPPFYLMGVESAIFAFGRFRIKSGHLQVSSFVKWQSKQGYFNFLASRRGLGSFGFIESAQLYPHENQPVTIGRVNIPRVGFFASKESDSLDQMDESRNPDSKRPLEMTWFPGL